MTKRGKRNGAGKLIPLIFGASLLQFSGCDPNVRSTLLTGLEATTGSLVDTLITAFFITLDDDEAGTDGGITTT